MPLPPTHAAAAVLLASLLGTAALAAEDDEPIPYGDEEEESPRLRPRQRPRRSDPTYIAPEETEVEKQDRETSLAIEDDPNTGIAGELISGAMLLDSSRGGLVETRFAWGLRFTWELGRYLPGDDFREALFGDVSWSYMGMRDGTRAVYGDSNYHYFTVAPAWGFPFWLGSDFSFYGQLGAGLAYQYSVLHAGGQAGLPISGIKPVFQYGVGVRGRPLLDPEGVLRLSFRAELTRFRRQYMDDTFLGGSVGVAF